MKKFNLLAVSIFISFLFAAISHAQDIIIKTDKTEIKSKVVELTDSQIKYKKFDMLDGPTYNINKADVFMIIYKNGTKEYMESSAPKPEQKQPDYSSLPKKNNLEKTKVNDTIKIRDETLSIATNSSGNSYDIEWTAFMKGNRPGKFGFGIDYFGSLSGTPSSSGEFIYIAYKYSFGPTHDFSIWGNAGYSWSTVHSYTIAGEFIPGSTSGGSLWEVGANFFFSKHIGVTAYTAQGNSEWFGISFRL